MGEGVWRRGKREIIYLSLHYHHQNDCIEMGSDESHFNVSLIVMDKVTRQRPQTTTLQQEAPALCMKAGYNNPTTTLLNNFAF